MSLGPPLPATPILYSPNIHDIIFHDNNEEPQIIETVPASIVQRHGWGRGISPGGYRRRPFHQVAIGIPLPDLAGNLLRRGAYRMAGQWSVINSHACDLDSCPAIFQIMGHVAAAVPLLDGVATSRRVLDISFWGGIQRWGGPSRRLAIRGLRGPWARNLVPAAELALPLPEYTQKQVRKSKSRRSCHNAGNVRAGF